jgi:exodeoxyribonuclease III
MRIATWNVNSVRQRVENLTAWLKEAAPDIVCLQEIKCLEETFPRLEIEALGYHVALLGQKTFNGVALLSKYQIEDVQRGLPGDETDEQARYIEAVVSTADGVVRVASIYAPNGNPLGTEKFPYKLGFLDRLIAHARRLLGQEEAFVLAGDYNIIPQPIDAAHPEQWTNDALFQPESRAKYRELLALGLVDALRATTDAGQLYTFWDYQAGAWPKNNGIRIDHLLLSPQAADRLQSVTIDAHVRGWDKPSDHVPIRIDLR